MCALIRISTFVKPFMCSERARKEVDSLRVALPPQPQYIHERFACREIAALSLDFSLGGVRYERAG